MKLNTVVSLTLGALISAGTAIAHLSCIVLGPSCYKAQLAPPEIIQSAIEGTWLAPVGTTLVSMLFLLCSLFALSGAGLIRKLPLLNIALLSIAVLCLFRAIATIPASYLFPDQVNTFSIAAGFVWFISGSLYLYGYYHLRKNNRPGAQESYSPQ